MSYERIESLRARHADLEQALHDETVRPQPDDDRVHHIKKQKLKVKDEIERLNAP